MHPIWGAISAFQWTSREIRLLPAGFFRANDGRPRGIPAWEINGVIAARIIAEALTRDDFVIDYEHQTLLSKQNGQPAPAAGWFKELVWKEGEGLFASNVRWTIKAQAMLDAKEYRFISPVFTFNETTGQVERLLGAGLTNNPGLTGLTDLAQLVSEAGQAHLDQESKLQLPAAMTQSDKEVMYRAFPGIFASEYETTDLAAQMVKPRLSPDMTESQKEMMHRVFPGIFAPE